VIVAEIEVEQLVERDLDKIEPARVEYCSNRLGGARADDGEFAVSGALVEPVVEGGLGEVR